MTGTLPAKDGKIGSPEIADLRRAWINIRRICIVALGMNVLNAAVRKESCLCLAWIVIHAGDRLHIQASID
jgi:hypothetical protein